MCGWSSLLVLLLVTDDPTVLVTKGPNTKMGLALADEPNRTSKDATLGTVLWWVSSVNSHFKQLCYVGS